MPITPRASHKTVAMTLLADKPIYAGKPVWFIWQVPDPVSRYSPSSLLTGPWLREAYYIYKQVRTNMGLAYTLIPSSFLYLIYMGGTGPCDSIKIIFGNRVYS